MPTEKETMYSKHKHEQQWEHKEESMVKQQSSANQIKNAEAIWVEQSNWKPSPYLLYCFM